MFGSKSAMACAGLLAAACMLSGVSILRHWRLQTDVLALLPRNERDPALQVARRLATGALGRTALYMVSHEQPQSGREATRQLGAWMGASPLFQHVQWDYSRQQRAFFNLYFPLRYQILSPEMRRLLDAPDGYQTLLQRLTQTLYQPTSALATRFLERDPLLFFSALARSWEPAAAGLQVEDGLLSQREKGRAHYIITAQLAFDPFATEAQIAYDAQWARWRRDLLQAWPGLQLASTSAARFASATRQRIHADITRISMGSILGVALLTFGVFRTFKHLTLALLPIGVGIWCALGVTLWLFGELHALTLAFGASLIGICIDYCFHYFAQHRLAATWRPRFVMQRLFPALSLGALTTVLSYLSLAFSPLAGLQQIAVFASCGIAVSFAAVAFGFPALLRHPHHRAHQPPLLHQGAQWIVRFWARFYMPLLMLCIIGVGLGLSSLRSLRVSDSPRALNALPQDLIAQDQNIRSLMGETQPQSYLIVSGDTAEAALQKLEALRDDLNRATGESVTAAVQFGPVLSDFLPSVRRQQANWAAAQSLLAMRQAIAAQLVDIGLSDALIASFFQTLQSAPSPWLRPDAWLRHDASAGLRQLWLGDNDGRVSILAPIRQVRDMALLSGVLARFEGVYYMDQIADFTRIFKRYRQQAMRLTGGAYLLVFALLLWRYGRRGVRIMLPPLLAALLTVEALALLGQTLHFMHGFALLLILGMGVDYSIFLAESPADEAPTALLALLLSALTTLLSFGLLSLSSQAVLQSLGLTTLIGIAAALLLAPIARYGRRSP